LELTVGGRDVVLWHEPGQSSALDADTVAGGTDIGTVGTFDPTLDGRHLQFERRGADVVDRQTGSRWNVLGQATAGPLEGAQLTAVRHLDTFWFAWAAFHPQTELLGSYDPIGAS